MDQQEGEKRYVNTIILCKEQKLLIKCINSCPLGELQKQAGEIVSTKGESRGIGLKSVRQIVEQLSGYSDFEKKDGEFIFSVVIPLHVCNMKQTTEEKAECTE